MKGETYHNQCGHVGEEPSDEVWCRSTRILLEIDTAQASDDKHQWEGE